MQSQDDTPQEGPVFPEESPSAGLKRLSVSLLVTLIKVSLLVFAVVGTASFATIFGIEVYDSYFKVPDEVEVPLIKGKEITEANQLLERLGLRLSVSESRYTKDYPDKVIIDQDPPPKRKVRKNREIIAVVSLGPELVDVPDLKGKTLREARIILANSRLRVGKVTYKKEDAGEPEQVLNQKPAPGDRVDKGHTVDLEVQKGGSATIIDVPNWAGNQVYRIDELIAKSHLQLQSIVWVCSDYVPKGQVVGQQPTLGQRVTSHTPVELEVSAGPSNAKLFKQRKLSIEVPTGTRAQRVSVVLNSEVGADTVFEGHHMAGDMELLVAGWQGSEVEVYINDRLQTREKL